MAYQDPYEQGGVTGGASGANLQALLKQLAGGTTSAGGTAAGNPAAPETNAGTSRAEFPQNPADPNGPLSPTGPTNTGPGIPAQVDRSQWNTKGFATPQYTASNYGTAPSGWDPVKWADPTHKSAKYEMRRALDPFNAQQGLTPEALAALNGLGYGNFSGSGQKLSLSGLTDAGRAAGLGGEYQNADFINQWANGGNAGATWGYADPYAEAQQAQSQPQQGGGIAPRGLPGSLLSDPGQNIQGTLDQYLQRSPNLAALLAQLGGG